MAANITGINVSKIPTIQKAIDEWIAAIEAEDIAAKTKQITASIKGTHKEVEVKALCQSMTSYVKNLTNKALPSDVTKNRGFYWQAYNEYPPFRISSDRTIDNICLEELASGIYTIVGYAVSIPINECYKKLIEFLGYSRVTETTRKRLDDALMLLKIDGKIIVNNDLISL